MVKNNPNMKTHRIVPFDFRSYLPAVLSGSVLVTAFPTFQLEALAWFCLVPFLLHLNTQDNKRAFKSGVLFGLVYFFGTQYWIYHSINRYGSVPFVISIVIVFMLSLYESLYTGFFALIYRVVMKRTGLPSVLTAPFIWTSMEYLRGHLFTGFPWSLIGYTQEGVLSIVQIADITGIYGVSFLIMLVNAMVTDVVLFIRLRKTGFNPSAWKAVFSIILTIAILGGSYMYGISKIETIQKNLSEARKVRISIIQGNIDQSKKWDRQYQDDVLKTYMELTRKAIKEGPDLVIWPETALPFYFDLDLKRTTQLRVFVKETGVPLLTGAMLIKDQRITDDKRMVYTITNSAILLDRVGKETYVYDKIHLVPFGEYVPLKDILFFIDKVVVGIGDYKPGTRYLRAHTSWGEFATIICYEAIFPDLVRRFFVKRGDLIVNITNDAWFGRTTGPYQHFSISRFRAIENRIPLLRAANTGISGVIGPSGRVLKKTELFKTAYITEEIPLWRGKSIYRRYGDIFSYLTISITVLLLAINSKKKIKIKGGF